MKVLKFGGTSVGTPESLACVKSIIENQSEPCVVVVSALGGITNRLIEMANRAADGDNSFETVFQEIALRHQDVILKSVATTKQTECQQKVNALLDELHLVCKAVLLLRELTPRSLDLIESYGERMSCLIVAAMIDGSHLVDSLEFIRTRAPFGTNVLDSAETSARISECFSGLEDKKVIIAPGFIARDEEGRISNLGRGGSDYTAAILAAELKARVLEIWTDVDGFMTADPRIVSEATVIDRLSFVEAMELCNFGAKVVYPPTIYPVFSANIPILIKNTFNATATGTLIAEGASNREILGVSAVAETCLISLEGAVDGLSDRMINSLTRNGVETFMPNNHCQCAIKKSDSKRAIEILSDKFAAELASGSIKKIVVTGDLSIVAIILSTNYPMTDTATTQFASALNYEGIPVAYAPRQASPGALACMVPHSFLNRAINAIHSSFINRK